MNKEQVIIDNNSKQTLVSPIIYISGGSISYLNRETGENACVYTSPTSNDIKQDK